MNQKGISSIVIILIIVGVLAIGGGIWYLQKQIIKENITIISPAEGEIWKNGESRTIKWVSVKGAEKVNIYLQEVWQEQNPVKVPIVENLGSLGKYDWKVSAKPIVTEGVYQIIVQSTDGYYRGISKAFKIIDNPSTSIDNIIQQSGFSKDEAELIIKAVIKAGAKKEEILQINKMTNGKVGVMTGDPNSYGPKRGGAMGYSAGKLYYLVEKDSNWEVESTSMWVE